MQLFEFIDICVDDDFVIRSNKMKSDSDSSISKIAIIFLLLFGAVFLFRKVKGYFSGAFKSVNEFSYEQQRPADSSEPARTPASITGKSAVETKSPVEAMSPIETVSPVVDSEATEEVKSPVIDSESKK